MKSLDFNPIMQVNDDSLNIQLVGHWAEEKYKLVGLYSNIFTKSMRNTWENLVYIDLFSGSGYSKIRNSKRIIKSSPLISLSLPFNFSKYIFCEEDLEKANSLNERIKRSYVGIDYELIVGDTNKNIDLIISKIPQYSKSSKVLTFCFVDIYSLKNLHFQTVKKLSKFALDFLILLPLGMDARRNFNYYLDKKIKIVDLYLSDTLWREKFLNKYRPTNHSFIQFISEEYKKKLLSLGYLEPERYHEIRSTDRNLPLYHLAFFSKHKLANTFWNSVSKYSTDELSFL